MHLLIILALFSSSIFYLAQSVCARRSKADSLALSLLLQTGAAMIILPGLVIWGDVHWPDLTSAGWLGLIFMVAWTLNIWFNFLSLKQIDASLFILVNLPTQIFLTVALSSLFLAESLHGLEYLGLIFLVLGILIAHFSHKSRGNTLVGLSYATASGVAAAIGLTAEKAIFDNSTNWSSYLALAVVLLFVGVGLFYLSQRLITGSAFKISANQISWRALVLAIIFLSAAIAGYGWGLAEIDNLAYLNSLWSFSVILTVVLAMIVLAERDHKLIKISGSLLATAGLLLLL